jgi:hypothetical protein
MENLTGKTALVTGSTDGVLLQELANPRQYTGSYFASAMLLPTDVRMADDYPRYSHRFRIIGCICPSPGGSCD